MKTLISFASIIALLGLCSCAVSNNEMISETQKCEAVGMDAVAEWNPLGGITGIDCIPSGHMHPAMSHE